MRKVLASATDGAAGNFSWNLSCRGLRFHAAMRWAEVLQRIVSSLSQPMVLIPRVSVKAAADDKAPKSDSYR